MEMSHVADDYAAIARRLKELREESEQAEHFVPQPGVRAAGDGPYRPNGPYGHILRSPRN
jgi:hypothetical protein